MNTGALSTSRGLDRENKAEYSLEVVATDKGSPALSATVTVQVRVLDVNDNNPVFTKNSYTVEVSEDAAEGTKVLEVFKFRWLLFIYRLCKCVVCKFVRMEIFPGVS